MKKGTGFLTLFGGAVALYALLAAPVSMRAQETETIEDGVYIGNIYVGGMTEEEAVSAVEAYVESADSAEMTLKTGDKSVSVTAADRSTQCVPGCVVYFRLAESMRKAESATFCRWMPVRSPGAAK